MYVTSRAQLFPFNALYAFPRIDKTCILAGFGIYIPFFIVGHLDCFQFFMVINGTEMNVFEYSAFSLSYFLGDISVSGITRSKGRNNFEVLDTYSEIAPWKK